MLTGRQFEILRWMSDGKDHVPADLREMNVCRRLESRGLLEEGAPRRDWQRAYVITKAGKEAVKDIQGKERNHEHPSVDMGYLRCSAGHQARGFPHASCAGRPCRPSRHGSISEQEHDQSVDRIQHAYGLLRVEESRILRTDQQGRPAHRVRPRRIQADRLEPQHEQGCKNCTSQKRRNTSATRLHTSSANRLHTSSASRGAKNTDRCANRCAT